MCYGVSYGKKLLGNMYLFSLRKLSADKTQKKATRILWCSRNERKLCEKYKD